MGPNGRRRWRKAARSRRKRGIVALTWGPKTSTDCSGMAAKGFVIAFLRRHRDSFHHEDGPPLSSLVRPLPSKPLDLPRSLVGMTQGARKRALRRIPSGVYVRDALRRAGHNPRTTTPWNDEEAYATACAAADVEVAKERARYRIGERLRPCRGGRDGCCLCSGSCAFAAQGHCRNQNEHCNNGILKAGPR